MKQAISGFATNSKGHVYENLSSQKTLSQIPEIPQFCPEPLTLNSRFDALKHAYTVITHAGPSRVQCFRSAISLHGCGKNGVPSKSQPSPKFLIVGASFRPRKFRAVNNQWYRNRYTWSGSYYNLVGRAAFCAEPGKPNNNSNLTRKLNLRMV